MLVPFLTHDLRAGGQDGWMGQDGTRRDGTERGGTARDGTRRDGTGRIGVDLGCTQWAQAGSDRLMHGRVAYETSCLSQIVDTCH